MQTVAVMLQAGLLSWLGIQSPASILSATADPAAVKQGEGCLFQHCCSFGEMLALLGEYLTAWSLSHQPANDKENFEEPQKWGGLN